MTRARGRAPYCERGKRGKKKVREEEEGRERERERKEGFQTNLR